MVVHFHVETVAVSCLDPANGKLDLFLLGAVLLNVVVSLALKRCEVVEIANGHDGESEKSLSCSCRHHCEDLAEQCLWIVITIPH